LNRTDEVATVGDVEELTLRLGDGRALHGYDRQIAGAAGPVVVWHHGTPNIGLPPEPLFALHGEADRLIPVTHSRWLAERCASAELRVTPNDGHISVLRHAGDALAWLAARGQ
jgi:pimeloyl-ACP methyl ester carboxylesterase